MLRPRVAVIVVTALAVAVIAVVGWTGRGSGDAPTAVPLRPTAISTATSLPTAVPGTLPASTPSPRPIVAPTSAATPMPPDPGLATLAGGTEVQNGRHGYTVWCASDAAGMCIMTERYGGPVPLETLHVPLGGVLTFTYRGPEPLGAISSLVYPLAGAGSGEYPTLRGGVALPIVQTDRQATITAPASPGEYAIVVRITGPKNMTADFQFRIAVN